MALDFTTTKKTRERRPITVDWVGHELTIEQPKEATVQLVTSSGSSTATQGQRIGAALAFLQATLPEPEWLVFQARMVDRDDPLNAGATIALQNRLLEQWRNWDQGDTAASLVIEEHPSELGDLEPVDFTLDGVEITAYPPKDLVLFQCYALVSDPYDAVQGMGLFLDGCLDRPQRLHISDRLRNQSDDFGFDELGEIITHLMGQWYPQGNREQRRASARKPATKPAARSRQGSRTPARR